MELLRTYEPDECEPNGYPAAWACCPDCEGFGTITVDNCGTPDTETCESCRGAGSIKDLVREQAGHRCVRCGHPYRAGERGNGEWSPCDERCEHGPPLRFFDDRGIEYHMEEPEPMGSEGERLAVCRAAGMRIEARWRILTCHHLDGNKANCRWWNLCPLDQRCHLQIQGRVNMAQVWAHAHSEWFRPYAAGYYAWVYLNDELTREQTMERLDELLALERAPM